tara:strand:- start:155 stop:682 length:528 start_codon:yes stop_codon:yes gene_type:complete
MMEDECIAFLDKLNNLFPGKLNKEQRGMWYGRTKGMKPFDANEALETYYTNPKKAADGQMPSIAGFLRCFMQHKNDRRSKKGHTSKSMTRYEALKWNLELGGDPLSGNETENDLEIRMAEREFKQSVITYGANDAGTRSRYETWSKWLDKGDYKTVPYNQEQWTTYQAECKSGAY